MERERERAITVVGVRCWWLACAGEPRLIVRAAHRRADGQLPFRGPVLRRVRGIGNTCPVNARVQFQ